MSNIHVFKNEIEKLRSMLLNTTKQLIFHVSFLEYFKRDIILQTYILNVQLWLFIENVHQIETDKDVHCNRTHRSG